MHLKYSSRLALPEFSGRQVFGYIVNFAAALGREHPSPSCYSKPASMPCAITLGVRSIGRALFLLQTSLGERVLVHSG